MGNVSFDWWKSFGYLCKWFIGYNLACKWIEHTIKTKDKFLWMNIIILGFYWRRSRSQTWKSRRSFTDVNANILFNDDWLLFIPREQEVSNLLVNKKYHEALKIALNLNQPYRTLTIIKGNDIYLSWKWISIIRFFWNRNSKWNQWNRSFKKYSITIFWWSFK
jgi:hypothetical protein